MTGDVASVAECGMCSPRTRCSDDQTVGSRRGQVDQARLAIVGLASDRDLQPRRREPRRRVQNQHPLEVRAPRALRGTRTGVVIVGDATNTGT